MSATVQSRGSTFPHLREAALRTSLVEDCHPRLATALLVMSAFILAHRVWPHAVPVVALVPLVIASALFLALARLYLVFGYALVWLLWLTVRGDEVPVAAGSGVLLVTMALMLLVAHSRAHHGVQAFAGDRMLGDLRTALLRMGEVSSLPAGWHAERAFATAHGHAFAGDFNVTTLDRGRGELELMLVDVSGNGQHAGTRALALSGAIGGILGSAHSEAVLPMTNAYLARARWEEGFATAVHVCLDLASGAVSVASAGHPPVVRYDSGRGRWERVTHGRGPALGLIADAEYPRAVTRLERGDALLLYTDGVIESPRGDLEDGVDWMLGQAEASMCRGFAGLADDLVARGKAGANDDRSAILIWRD